MSNPATQDDLSSFGSTAECSQDEALEEKVAQAQKLINEAEGLYNSPIGNNDTAFYLAYHAVELIHQAGYPSNTFGLLEQSKQIRDQAAYNSAGVLKLREAEQYMLLVKKDKKPEENIKKAMECVVEAKEKISNFIKTMLQYCEDNLLLDLTDFIVQPFRFLSKAEQLDSYLMTLIKKVAEKANYDSKKFGAFGHKSSEYLSQADSYINIAQNLLSHQKNIKKSKLGSGFELAERQVNDKQKQLDAFFKRASLWTRFLVGFKSFFSFGRKKEILTAELKEYKAFEPDDASVEAAVDNFGKTVTILPRKRFHLERQKSSTATMVNRWAVAVPAKKTKPVSPAPSSDSQDSAIEISAKKKIKRVKPQSLLSKQQVLGLNGANSKDAVLPFSLEDCGMTAKPVSPALSEDSGRGGSDTSDDEGSRESPKLIKSARVEPTVEEYDSGFAFEGVIFPQNAQQDEDCQLDNTSKTVVAEKIERTCFLKTTNAPKALEKFDLFGSKDKEVKITKGFSPVVFVQQPTR